MKKLLGLVCLGSVLLGALYSPAALAGGQTYTLSGTTSAPSYYLSQNTVITAPSAATVSGSLYLVGSTGSGTLSVMVNNSYPGIFVLQLASYLPASSGQLISGSANVAANAYYVTECIGGYDVSGTVTTTFSW